MADELALVLGDAVPDVVLAEQAQQARGLLGAEGGVQPSGANER